MTEEDRKPMTLREAHGLAQADCTQVEAFTRGPSGEQTHAGWRYTNTASQPAHPLTFRDRASAVRSRTIKVAILTVERMMADRQMQVPRRFRVEANQAVNQVLPEWERGNPMCGHTSGALGLATLAWTRRREEVEPRAEGGAVEALCRGAARMQTQTEEMRRQLGEAAALPAVPPQPSSESWGVYPDPGRRFWQLKAPSDLPEPTQLPFDFTEAKGDYLEGRPPGQQTLAKHLETQAEDLLRREADEDARQVRLTGALQDATAEIGLLTWLPGKQGGGVPDRWTYGHGEQRIEFDNHTAAVNAHRVATARRTVALVLQRERACTPAFQADMRVGAVVAAYRRSHADNASTALPSAHTLAQWALGLR